MYVVSGDSATGWPLITPVAGSSTSPSGKEGSTAKVQ
eukprot:CAMPEP_0181504606 /NCGR_PEP_ID=MMETSP1110-20121109/57602_1 /TAXON_ID=174948 /ORGANISM="Symbiodinium sp., Strain CCMP421" /LENGTH=36 /DNA_ID= /DNA_START= /DNA_END= /DNA_ORIENTATION=